MEHRILSINLKFLIMLLTEFTTIWANRAEMYAANGDLVFFEFAAHVRIFYVRIYKGGWKPGAEPDAYLEFKFDKNLKLIVP